MDLPDDFNSSDVEFEPAPRKASGRRPGQASIAKIVKKASNDRLSSKCTLRAKFENLQARITVEFRKGSQDKRNDNLEFYLRSLNDPNFYHMCPIALLLIHALRHGLVLGSIIEQVLESAANASDAKVVWLFPDRPLFAVFSHKSTSVCDLDKPAGNDQVLQTIRLMGIISNILCRVYVDGLRLGAAQDIAHLPMAKEGSGFTTDQVRQSLGHSHSAFHRERQFVSRWGPKFSETSALNIVKQSVTDEEIENGSSSTSHPLWTLTPSTQGEVLGITSAASASQASCALPDETRRRRRMERKKHWSTANDVNVISKIATSIQERSQARFSTVPTACPPHLNAQPGFEREGGIDPRLLDEDAFKNMQVDDVEIEGLNAEVLMTSSQVSGSEAAAEMSCMDALLEMQKTGVSGNSQCLTSAYDFIRAYSKINIVSKHTFATAWKRYREGSTSFQGSI
ncbi:hypothetical protein V1520DRAFT_388908 [Lipomyces starkeyi]|uniref:Uncharacterized protein n=1 Tax=Lipomyces starkeyi NRRL Y-11557 TaxID=675824 RepID=A0A1E3Q9X6_LIPST|nr:hypothetical protein LIPSTDRAFT_2475 [Lipomyces starkeyi NRRL Y-11557]